MKKGQEPAFPVVGSEGLCTALGNIGENDCSGLSTRLYLAGMAMQGILASNSSPEWYKEKQVSELALSYADELIKQEEETR